MNFALNLSVLRSEIASFHIWRLYCRSLRSEENPGAPLQGPEIVRYVDRQENCWKKLIAKCRFGELLNPGISTMQSIVLPISSVLGGQHGHDGGSKQKQSGMENWNILFDVSRYDSQLHVGMRLLTWLNNIQFQDRPTNVIHCGSTNQTFSNISDIKTHIFSNNTQWHLYIMCKDLHLTGWTI